MIKQIQKLALTCASINILARAKENGELSLTFIPQARPGAEGALTTPFTLTGTPEELEAGLDEALASIIGKRETLAEQVAATNTLLEMAAKDSAAKGTKALQGKGPKALPAPAAGAASSDEDDDIDADGSNTDADKEIASTGSTGSTASASPALNLFE